MKAVIFDMDGVIVNSEPLWKQAEQEVFSVLGVTVTDELAALTKSMTTTAVTKFWFDKYPWQNKTLDEAEEMVVARVIELIKTEDCNISGIKEFIEGLKRKNIKIGLATNSPYRIIKPVLQKAGIEHLFDTISSAEHEEKGKPDPSVYLAASYKLNIEPAHCFAIEDSYSGMLAAKNAGMAVIAFTNCNKELCFDIADHTIDDFENIDMGIFQSGSVS